VPDDYNSSADVRLNRLSNMVLESAVDLLGADAASVTALHDGDLSTIATTDSRVVFVDEVQYASRRGPCLDALDPGAEPVIVADMDHADEWPEFRDAARDLGVRTSVSVHVPVDSDDFHASLNVYVRRQYELGDREARIAGAVAEQLAAAIESAEAERAAAELASQMAEAMRSRALIEQAKGIVMAARRITADEAFSYLATRSMSENRKLREVSAELVERASRPDPERR
jgi:GAF domain-containing protein